jgi:FkbM family methyltransferase
VQPAEEHGRALTSLGVIDLPVTETIWRLLQPGEVAVDVGANIGYMTSLMAHRIQHGSVWSFEAHPEVFGELRFNTSVWETKLPHVNFQVRQLAISDRQAEVTLAVPEAFAGNRGLSFVAEEDGGKSAPKRSFSVPSASLDHLFRETQIGLLKVDVEGHEHKVLEGAQELLNHRQIRDVVFEEHGAYPTRATSVLEAAGYLVFRISRTFSGPTLLLPDSKVPRSDWEPTSFLATRDPERALELLKRPGWLALRRESNMRVDASPSNKTTRQRPRLWK